MKNTKYIIPALSAACLMFISGSCNKNDEGTGGKKLVTFASTIVGSKQTKASGTSWGNDNIGVYMLTASSDMAPENVIDGNKKYSTHGDGLFAPASESEAVYFPYNGSSVDFVAYYPYTADVSDYAFTVDVSDQSNLAAIDILYSNNATGKNKNSTAVSLGFSHMLTNLVFEVSNLTGENINDITITISGMKTSSSFSIANGSLTDNPASAADITAQAASEGATALCEAIVLPAEGLTGAKVKIDIPSLSRYYEWNIPDGQNYNGKTRYTYELNLKGEELVVVNPSATITDWISGPKETITLDPQTPPAYGGDGSENNPLTTNQLAGNIGKTDKWVTGYVAGVSGATRSASFSAPFSSKSNILIAARAGETDFSKCFSVALDEGSDIQASLNLMENEELLGKAIKVKGDIVANLYGTGAGVTSLTEQSGGNDNQSDAELTEYFHEQFGQGLDTGYSCPVSSFSGWSMKKPVTYSDSYSSAEIKVTSIFDPHVWMMGGCDSHIKINNIPTGYKNITLSFQIAAYKAGTDAGIITIKSGETLNPSQPDVILANGNTYYDIELPLPDNTATLEFFASATDNKSGNVIRIDNIKLKGAAVTNIVP